MEDFQYILDCAKKLGHTVEILSPIKSGKEASVFSALLDGRLVAVKIYTNPKERAFQNSDAYLAGKFYQRASEARAIGKGNAFGRRLKQDSWITREFFLLQKLHTAGAVIPEPILQIENALFMELLGDEEIVAGRLIDTILSEGEAALAFQTVLKSTKIFWDLGIVHGDLSPYNILWWKSRPYIIDFPQSIDARTHPDARAFLERDLKNIVKYFRKFITIDFEEVFSRFL